jgi:hypothetical protein
MLYNCVTTVLSEANYPPPKTLFDAISDIHIFTNSFKQNEEFKMTPPNVVLLLDDEKCPVLLVHEDVLEKLAKQPLIRIEVDKEEVLIPFWGWGSYSSEYKDYRCTYLVKDSIPTLIEHARRLSAIIDILLEEVETEDTTSVEPTVLFEG